MNVLIVDDQEENLYLLESLLRGSGHAVRLAFNGAEALEILKEDGIDLIISDILMPVMDGFQLCRKVRNDDTLRAIPLIFYTATYTSSKDEEFALNIGADRFIVKPCEPDIFLKAVHEVMADTAARRGKVSNRNQIEDGELFKLYSERLVRKLEQKVLEMESEIQAHQETQKKLHESEEKFRNIFQKHLAVKLIIDPDNGDIVEANEAAEKFYGWTGDQLRQMRIQDINILSSDEVNEAMKKASTMERTRFEFRHRLSDGSIKDVEVFSSRIDIKEKSLLHSIIHDITEHKRSEEERESLRAQFIQAQKMESVGQLAGGVAHDFNNMLSVILGQTELALSRISPKDPLHAVLGEILNAANRSADITRQLLAFARKQTIAPKVLDMNAIVADMLKIIKRLIGEDIVLTWLPADDLWSVKIDPSQIEQILANLCINARDAIGGVGRITIETHSVAFGTADCAAHEDFLPGDFVLLTVSDDGSGMDSETQSHIFEPFFTTKAKGEGTGLGLATVYGIVKQNGGFINTYSEPGVGTTFRIYFPRHLVTADNIVREIVTETPLSRGETVLLVEDEEPIRAMGCAMLESLGYRTMIAATPTEAIRMAQECDGRIDLLFTDVVMPEMNGRDLANRLHSRYPDIGILFMSGYTSDVIAQRGILEDGINFIQKPFSMRNLGIKLREVLEGSQTASDYG
ncbi:MAG: response regulator [Deltaproteobacteria bacterium]|nr:response regulator [Deltaproteobacteria bacterium]